MGKMKLHSLNQLFFVLIIAIGSTNAFADEVSDMQKRLNEQVLGQSFSVESEANLNAYIEEATKRGIPPKTTPSKYWRRGYTCGDLRRYSWTDYRDCSYFYRYYGYYWPY